LNPSAKAQDSTLSEVEGLNLIARPQAEIPLI